MPRTRVAGVSRSPEPSIVPISAFVPLATMLHPEGVEGVPLERALTCLRANGAVAVATESFFALAVDATSASALDFLMTLKPRDSSKGVGLMVPAGEQWRRWVRNPPRMAEAFAHLFWPGPLTLVLPAAAELDERLVVRGHVALRVPGPSPAMTLVDAWQGPLTATSANQTGKPPCCTSRQVTEQFPEHDSEALHVVEGQGPGGPVSTLVRVSNSGWEVVREGAISRAQLERVRG